MPRGTTCWLCCVQATVVAGMLTPRTGNVLICLTRPPGVCSGAFPGEDEHATMSGERIVFIDRDPALFGATLFHLQPVRRALTLNCPGVQEYRTPTSTIYIYIHTIYFIRPFYGSCTVHAVADSRSPWTVPRLDRASRDCLYALYACMLFEHLFTQRTHLGWR